TMTARDSLKALVEELRAQQPKTASDSLALMDAYSNEIIAEAYVTAGDNEVADLMKNAQKMTKDDVYKALFSISNHYSNAEIFIHITKSGLAVYLDEGKAPPPDLDTVTGLAEMLRRAGEANMAAFDSITVADLAQTYNLRDEVAKARLADLDDGF